MYTSIFLICDGCLTMDTMGFLKGIEPKTSRTTIWTSASAGSLIVFLKCLGFNYDQIIGKLTLLGCLTSIVYGGSLEPGSSNDIKQEIEGWMEDILESKKLFGKDVTLKEIYKLTRIFPNFISSKGSLNPSSAAGDIKLRDAVLSSMCNIGVFEEHIIDGVEFSPFLKFDPYPYKNFDLEIDGISEPKNLYIANYSKLHIAELYSIFDEIENKLIQEYFDRVLEIAKVCDKEDFFVLINGLFIKTEMDSYDIKSHIVNGSDHAIMFNNGETTVNYMDELLFKIKNQS
jgi:hypothetical protein